MATPSSADVDSWTTERHRAAPSGTARLAPERHGSAERYLTSGRTTWIAENVTEPRALWVT